MSSCCHSHLFQDGHSTQTVIQCTSALQEIVTENIHLIKISGHCKLKKDTVERLIHYKVRHVIFYGCPVLQKVLTCKQISATIT